MSSKGESNVDFIAQERDAKYKAWLQIKTLRDKALEYLNKLDKKRADEEEPCSEVAKAFCAIQRLMGVDGSSSGGGGGDGNEENELDNMAAPKVRLDVDGNVQHLKNMENVLTNQQKS